MGNIVWWGLTLSGFVLLGWVCLRPREHGRLSLSETEVANGAKCSWCGVNVTDMSRRELYGFISTLSASNASLRNRVSSQTKKIIESRIREKEQNARIAAAGLPCPAKDLR